MINIGKWITKHKNIILVIAFILLIPAGIGYVSTRVNYDVLSYLPERLRRSRDRIFWWMSSVWERFPW